MVVLSLPLKWYLMKSCILKIRYKMAMNGERTAITRYRTISKNMYFVLDMLILRL